MESRVFQCYRRNHSFPITKSAECGVLWTDFERCVMPISIICRAISTGQLKYLESQGPKSFFSECLKVSYMDINAQSSILFLII